MLSQGPSRTLRFLQCLCVLIVPAGCASQSTVGEEKFRVLPPARSLFKQIDVLLSLDRSVEVRFLNVDEHDLATFSSCHLPLRFSQQELHEFVRSFGAYSHST